MTWQFKTKWLSENPPWLWFVFTANTIFVAIAIASMMILITQQQYLICEVREIDRKLVIAIKINHKQQNINVVTEETPGPKPLTASPK